MQRCFSVSDSSLRLTIARWLSLRWFSSKGHYDPLYEKEDERDSLDSSSFLAQPPPPRTWGKVTDRFSVSCGEPFEKYIARERFARIKSFLASVRRAAETADPRDARAAARAAAAAVERQARTGTPVTSDLIAEAIEACSAPGSFDIASRLFYHMHFEYQCSRGERATMSFLNACAAAGRWQEAKRVLEWAIDPSSPAWTPKKNKDIQYSSQKPVTRVTPEMLVAFLNAACGAAPSVLRQHLDEIISFYTRVKSADQSIYTHAQIPQLVDALIRLYSYAGDWRGAISVFDRAVRALSRSSPLPQTSTASENAGSILSREAALQHALDLSEDTKTAKEFTMRLEGSQGRNNFVTFIPATCIDPLISCCFKSGRHYEVVRILQTISMLQSESVDNYTPDEDTARMGIFSVEEVTFHTYKNLLGTNNPELLKEQIPIYLHLVTQHAGQGVSGEDAVLAFGEENGGVDPQRWALSETDLQRRMSAWELACQLFTGLADSGFPLYPQTYESPIRSCVCAGQWRAALNIVAEMKKDDRIVEPHVYTLVMGERIAQESSTREALRLRGKFSELLGGTQSLAYHMPILRHALAVRNERLFEDTLLKMRGLELVETPEKLQLLIFAGIRRRQIRALVAYSRLVTIMKFELERTAKTSDYIPFNFIDGCIPPVILEKVKEIAQQYLRTMDAASAAAQTENNQLLLTEKGSELISSKKTKVIKFDKDNYQVARAVLADVRKREAEGLYGHDIV